MRKTTCLLLLLGAVLAFAGPAAAVTCALDRTPGATLLLPYFEVDVANPNGVDTVFTIGNASASATLVHVTLYTDLAVPTYQFNVYLTGYDAETIDLRLLFGSGFVPRTASDGQDLTDTISPQGAQSQDINYPGCGGVLPQNLMTSATITALRAAHTGTASSLTGNLCAGLAKGDNVARGYVTIDVVTNCTSRFPDTPGYFPPGAPADAGTNNNIFGSFQILNRTQGWAAGGALPAVEADAVSPATTTPGRYTFYGRYTSWQATDNREPLASSWAVRYTGNTSTLGQNTDLIIWRDPKVAGTPFACGTTPAWYPLSTEGYTIFDEQEHPTIPPMPPVFPLPPPITYINAPAAAQRVALTVDAAPSPFGWIYLDLNTPGGGGGNPSYDSAAAQAFVMSVTSIVGGGLHGVALPGIALDSVCSAQHFNPLNSY